MTRGRGSGGPGLALGPFLSTPSFGTFLGHQLPSGSFSVTGVVDVLRSPRVEGRSVGRQSVEDVVFLAEGRTGQLMDGRAQLTDLYA